MHENSILLAEADALNKGKLIPEKPPPIAKAYGPFGPAIGQAATWLRARGRTHLATRAQMGRGSARRPDITPLSFPNPVSIAHAWRGCSWRRDARRRAVPSPHSPAFRTMLSAAPPARHVRN